eukprot:COSAG05_NODE_19167_length_296_cov_2.091371_1_plen_53_part_10
MALPLLATASMAVASVTVNTWQVPVSVLTTDYDVGVLVFTLQGLANRVGRHNR